MKKILFFIILFVFLIFSSCSESYTSTTSSLKIIEKGHSNNYKEYWIKAYDFNNYTEDEAFTIIVDELMVWNLIEENKEYFTTYSKKGDNAWNLIQIEHNIGPQK